MAGFSQCPAMRSGDMSNDFCTRAPCFLEGYPIALCISSYSDHILLCHRLPLARATIVSQDAVHTAATSVPTRNHRLPSWWAAQVFRTTASSHKITPLADLVVSKLFLIFSIIHTEQNIAFKVQPHGCQMERDHCMCCWVSQKPPSFFLCATLP